MGASFCNLYCKNEHADRLMDTGGAREAVAQWAVVQSRKRPGVLSCAVREAGIPSSVCARILTETNSGLYI